MRKTKKERKKDKSGMKPGSMQKVSENNDRSRVKTYAQDHKGPVGVKVVLVVG